jgi:radical SAM protein with 4Fe4S-binding SPASM domain
MRMYSIDVNITRACTFKCEYCFARPNSGGSFKDVDGIRRFIEMFMSSKFFMEGYDLLNIGLWGGEPTLFPHLVENLVEEYSYNDDVKFFIFSNGYRFKRWLRELLIKYKDEKVDIHPRLCIQVSYDGQPIHDLRRQTQDGQITGAVIKRHIEFLDEMRIPYVIKSTIMPKDFIHMYDAYMDIKAMAQSLHGTGYKALNYFPTIDYYNEPDGDIDQWRKDLQNSLIRIAREEMEMEVPLFRWFQPNRALCATGAEMIAVDVNGDIHTCHGCIYDENSDHLIGNIAEADIIEKIEETQNKFRPDIDFEPDECKKCPVYYCLRCNHAKYVNSEKEFYLNRWRDYASQPHLCSFFMENYKVVEAMRLIRRSK